MAEENGSFHQEEQEEGVYADRITVASGEALAEGNALIIYQGLWIKADTIRYYLETTEIIVSGNVHFNNGEYQLWAEKMEGNLQDELVLTGNSRLSYNDIEAESDTIIYNINEETALLEGSVRGNIDDIEVSGEELFLDLPAERYILSSEAKVLFQGKGD